MMTEGSVCLFIAAVLIFTVIPIHGQKEKCKIKDFKWVDGVCYKFNKTKLNWTAAKEDCEKQNVELAPYNNQQQIRTLCKTGAENVWIKAPELQEQGVQWSYDCVSDYFTLFYEECKAELNYFCIETNNTLEEKPIIAYRSIEKRNSINEIPKLTCLRKDAVLVDGKCYRSPTHKESPSFAEFYCADENETLATIPYIDDGIKVIELLDLIGQKLWVKNKSQTREGTFVSLINKDNCKQYQFGNLPETNSLRFLCMKLAMPYIETTTTPASTTTKESQGKKKDGLQLVKKVVHKTRVDLDTNLYFYEK